MSALNDLLGKLRTYYGDDLACRTLLLDARRAIETLRDENGQLREALAKIERLTQLRITEREHEANRTAVSALKFEASVTEDSSVTPANHIVDANKMVPTSSPSVCVWTHSDTNTASSCLRGGVTNWMWNGRFQDKCPNCLKPIEFTESKP